MGSVGDIYGAFSGQSSDAVNLASPNQLSEPPSVSSKHMQVLEDPEKDPFTRTPVSEGEGHMPKIMPCKLLDASTL